MNWLAEFARRVGMLFRGRKFDREMEEEMRLHLELREREHAGNGLSAAEAHMAARKHFGNALALREASHDSWGWVWLEHLLQDLRFAFRMFAKTPGFTATVVLTLALGIGANTAIFSMIDSILLRPLPIEKPSQVVVIQENLPKLNLFHTTISTPDFRNFSRHADLFQSTALMVRKNLNLTGEGQPQRLVAMRATRSLFPLLGIRPVLGRTFTAEEDTYGSGHVALLSADLWKSLFGSSREAIGKSMQLNGQRYRIIGVLPEKLGILYPHVQLWIPMAFSPQAFSDEEEGDLCCTMLARLRAEINLQQANAAMAVDAVHELASAPPQIRPMMQGFGIEARSLREEKEGDVSQPLYLLLGAVLLVLLIACANVANLLLARGSLRTREIAVRAAIGAGRRRIVSQLLTESLLLSLVGGAVGVLFAWWGVKALINFAPASVPQANAIQLNAFVLGFAFVVSVLSGIFFGLAPAVHASKIDLNDSLKESTRTGGSVSVRYGLRRALILCEVALTFVLLAGSGLLLKSFAKLLDVNVGFDPANVLTMRLSPSQQSNSAQAAAFSRALLSRLSAIPEVAQAALAGEPPLMDPGNSIFLIRDYHTPVNGPQPHADNVMTSPDYFATLRIRLLYGRFYTDDDIQTKNDVVVVDQTLAERFWPGQSALGKQIGWDSKGPWSTIIGVVGAVRSHTLARESEGTLYFPGYYEGMSLVVRTSANPAALTDAVRAQLQALDPSQVGYDVETMEQRIAESAAQQRFSAMLLALFAVLALVLAIIGLYSVLAYMVAQRTHEMGVRMALGAKPRDVLRLVIGQGLKVAGIGVAVGIALALGLTRLMASLLYGVSASDPAIFAGGAILLLVVAVAACYVPARRAAKVDPMTALRYE